jgi:hypothetical protein
VPRLHCTAPPWIISVVRKWSYGIELQSSFDFGKWESIPVMALIPSLLSTPNGFLTEFRCPSSCHGLKSHPKHHVYLFSRR